MQPRILITTNSETLERNVNRAYTTVALQYAEAVTKVRWEKIPVNYGKNIAFTLDFLSIFSYNPCKLWLKNAGGLILA